jgi:NAD(P)-dependent dehydrogenase (short-subunit alcohol dehydrogenase family)
MSGTSVNLDRTMAGRVAVVSGVGDGIGRACALALAADGADLVLGARDGDRLERIAGEVRSAGHRVIAVPTDITDAAQARHLVDTAAAEFGRLDGVVNVAALSGPAAPVEEFDPESYRRSFEVNVIGTLEVSRSALPHLRSTGGGAIVQISALSAHTRLPGLADYTSTKSALVTASVTLAKEVGRDGIRVNVVVPGYTSGEGLDRYLDAQAARKGITRMEIDEQILRSSALRRFPDPSDMAEAVLYLCSERSRAVTGQLLHVNAGEWIA